MTTLSLQTGLTPPTRELPESPEVAEEAELRRHDVAQKIAELNPLEAEDKEDKLDQLDQLVHFSRSEDTEIAESAQNKLFAAITPTIKGTIRRTLGKSNCIGQTEDFCQTAMEKIYKYGIIRGKYKEGNFTAYAAKVAVNTTLDYFRSRDYKLSLILYHSDMEDSGEAPKYRLPADDNVEEEATTMTANEFKQLLKDTDIYEGYQDVAYLMLFEDKSEPEIAEILNIPINTVRTRVHRSNKQIRKAFEENPTLLKRLQV